MKTIPKTPFSTPLSGSAKETQRRIRNLFSGPKQRPALLAAVLAVALIALCGSFVAFRSGEAPVEDEALLNTLLAGTDLMAEPQDTTTRQVLARLSGDGVSLAAAAICDTSRCSFAIGVVDDSTGGLSGSLFQAASSGRLPHVAVFQRADGTQCLLYTANGIQQGISYGEAGLVTFDGKDFTWEWPVEGDVRDETSQAYRDYQAYWESHLALMSPGGVEVFAEDPDFGPYEGSPAQWTPENSCSFYPCETDSLTVGVTWQVRGWLEAFTRTGLNPYDAVNVSAAWRVVSLRPSEPMDLSAQRDTPQTLYLLAAADNDDSLYFAAKLLFEPNPEDGQSIRVLDYAMGGEEEVDRLRCPEPDYSLRDQLVLDYYQQANPGSQCYYAGGGPDAPREGDLRIDSLTYAGEAATYETVGVAYLACVSVYAGAAGSPEWQSREPEYIVLEKSAADGAFTRVRGAAARPAGEAFDIKSLILSVTYQLSDIEFSLWRDGYPSPVGLGSESVPFFSTALFESLEVLDDPGQVLYGEGDYWALETYQGFSGLRYYSRAAGRSTLITIETTRTDLSTYRGVRVGDSRDAVQAAYPVLYDSDYWGRYPGEDCLWYCASGEGWGNAILFFFEDGKVSRIVLNNMFD